MSTETLITGLAGLGAGGLVVAALYIVFLIVRTKHQTNANPQPPGNSAIQGAIMDFLRDLTKTSAVLASNGERQTEILSHLERTEGEVVKMLAVNSVKLDDIGQHTEDQARATKNIDRTLSTAIRRQAKFYPSVERKLNQQAKARRKR